MELKQFQQPPLTVDSFKTETVQNKTKVNSKTASQLAAGEIMLSGQPTIEDFRSLRESLLTGEGQRDFLMRQEERRREIIDSFKTDLVDILLDPNLTDEDKTEFITGVRVSPDTFKPKQIDILVQEALLNPSKVEESEEEGLSRFNASDLINEVNKLKVENTIRLNTLRNEKDQSKVDIAVDIAELFIPFAEWVNINQIYQEMVGGDAWLMGNQKEQLFSIMEKMPIAERAQLTEKIIEFVEDNNNLLLPDGNDFIALDNITQIVNEQDYSNTERWIDNTVSILEVTGIFALLGSAARGVKSGKRLATLKPETHSTVSPTSPSELIKDVNPEKHRAIHETIDADKTGEAAEALAGTTREEALAKNLLPEPEFEEGVLPNKVVQRGPEFPEPNNIRELRNLNTTTFLTEGEKVRIREGLVNHLSDVQGMKAHPEGALIRTNENGTLGITMKFHPTDAGFSNPTRAMDNAKFAFRHYGLDERHLTLYRRSGDKWIVTSQNLLDARAELRAKLTENGRDIPPKLRGDDEFAVGLDFNYKFKPEDLQGYDLLQPGKILGFLPINILDRLPPGIASIGQGSVTQHLFDASSVLHPQIVEPAVVLRDRSSALKKAFASEFDGFTTKFKAMKQDRKTLITDYINEANDKGLKFDEVNLRARGFNTPEIDALRQWRRANDAMFHATNEDMAKSLTNRGFKIFTHSGSDTKLMVRPIKRGSVNSNTQYYDVNTNEIRTPANVEELDSLYEGGGTLVQLHEPIKINEEWIDVVRVEDKAESGYLRAISEGEQVLNYRDGYYPVMYDANFFITKTIRKADGTTFEKTIASAKNKEDALRLKEMVQASDPDAVVDFRPDRRELSQRSNSFDDRAWSLSSNSGLSSQRVRGERLADLTGGLEKAGRSNLLDPLEAVGRQIEQLSKRVVMRDYFDTVKARWVDNYAEALGLEKDRTGNFKFPSSVTQIKGKGDTPSQLVADARSLFNYIHHIENGYINLVDEGFKATFNLGADLISSTVGNKWAEEALRNWGRGSPTSGLKGAVFKMYLAANPVRQLIVQSHQSVQLNAINPVYTSGGGMATDLFRLSRARLGYKGDPEAQQMLKELQQSGLMDAIDENNLVRQEMTRLADVSFAQELGTLANKPIKTAQILGFDTGERTVLLTSWLAHRDLWLKANKGKKLDRQALDEIHGKARSFTWNMNEAGDMPYNQNSLNVIAQFLQVPHKAFLQPLVNRSLTPRERAQVLTWNTVMFGIPAGITTEMLQNSFEPSILRDAIESGLEEVLLNEVLTQVTGEQQSIDWGSSLAPSDMHGLGEFVVGLMTGDISKMVSEAPATSLFFGSNPRMTEAVKTTARWFNLRDDYDDPELNTKFSDVVISFASLASGYSSAFKAKYAFETGQKMSSLGGITDDDVTKVEAAMQVGGFRTKTEEDARLIREEIFGGGSFNEGPGGDVDKWYTELKRQLARKNMTVRDKDLAQRIITEGLRVFEDEPHKFRERLFNLVKNDVESGSHDIITLVKNQMGWRTRSELLPLVNQLPDGESKTILLEAIDRLGE